MANLSRAKRLPTLQSLITGGSRPVTDDERDWVNQIRAAEDHRPIPEHLTRSRKRRAEEGATSDGR